MAIDYVKKLKRDFGSVVMDALNDPTTIEVMLNTDGKVWVEQFGKGMQVVGSMTAVDAVAVINAVAASLDTVVTRESPIIEGELPLGGQRFEAMIPPVVSSPVFAIRVPPSKIFTLADYVTQGVMTEQQCAVIEDAIAARRNILVVGGTGSGKTTLANAVIDGIARLTPDDRVVIIEDTAEIQCAATNQVILRSTLDVSMQRLLKATLRMRPDRILVGEVRGSEALALLKAWNTGHPGGIATLHANDAAAGLMRLEQLVSEGGQVVGVEAMIAEAVGLVIVIKKDVNSTAGRVISELVQVQGAGDAGYNLKAC